MIYIPNILHTLFWHFLYHFLFINISIITYMIVSSNYIYHIFMCEFPIHTTCSMSPDFLFFFL
ncbi:hypothetical protein BDC45DRAFT_502727, partial [Circinella umbellata]